MQVEQLTNKKLYVESVTEEFISIFGEEETEIIFDYLEVHHKIPRNQIPDKIEDFKKTLELIFGEASTIIKQNVIKNLREKIKQQ